MKSVMLSIKPKYCELIASGKKTIEVRKTKPKLKTPFKCFIYECKGKEVSKIIDIPKEQGGGVLDYYEYEGCGKVIGEFVCDAIIVDKTFGHDDLFNAAACLSVAEVAAYCINKETFGWHISDLVIYDKPKELSEYSSRSSVFTFSKDGKLVFTGMTRPPQSWCYVMEVKE